MLSFAACSIGPNSLHERYGLAGASVPCATKRTRISATQSWNLQQMASRLSRTRNSNPGGGGRVRGPGRQLLWGASI